MIKSPARGPLLAIAVSSMLACSPGPRWPLSEPVVLDPGPGPSQGQGRVVLLEYGSLDCDVCQRFHEEVMPALRSEGPDFLYLYRESLVHRSEDLLQLAALSECAGESVGYWTVHNWMLEEAPDRSAEIRSWEDAVRIMAAQFGMDASTLRACAEEAPRQAKLRRRSARAEAIGVAGVPTFVIGRMRLTGEVAGWALRGLPPIDTLRYYMEAANR